MKGETETQILTYRNALEPLVEAEVRSQLEQLSSRSVQYLRAEEAIAFALVCLHCTRRRRKDETNNSIARSLN